MKVAVIGGGWAGMAAAVELAAAGVPVTVYEAARIPGGRARRVDTPLGTLDNGQHILLGAYRDALRLIAQVNPGTPATELYLRMPLALDTPGQLRLATVALPAPLHLLLGLATARGLGVGERLAAIRMMLALRAARWRVEPDCSVALLLERHRQSARLQRLLWEPVCVAALNTPPGLASGRVFASVLRDSLGGAREASDVILPRVDLSRLFPEPAMRYVESRGGEVRLGCPARAVWRSGVGFAVEADDVREFTHAVCAVPPWRVAALLGGFTSLASAAIPVEARGFQPIYTAYLKYPDSVALSRPMLGMNVGFVQWVFDRGALGGPQGLLAAVISAEGAHESMPQSQLAQRIHRELDEVLGPLPKPEWQRVIAEKRATFTCVPELNRPAQRTAVRGLYLAGDWTAGEYPAVLEAAVRSGIQCAALALADR